MKKPNILFIMADEQKANSIGCYDNKHAVTPNIDRMSAQGVQFSRFYVQNPICVASRVNFFSGQYSHTSNAHSNAKGLDPDNQPHLARMLQTNGYETSLFGKDHMLNIGHSKGKKHRTCGFDEWNEFYDPKQPSKRCKITDRFKKFITKKGPLYRAETVPGDMDAEYPPVSICDAVIEYLKERDASKPFFVWLSFLEPHPPFYARQRDLDLYKDLKKNPYPNAWAEHGGKPRRVTEWYQYCKTDSIAEEQLAECVRYYYAMNSAIDEQVGRVLDCLQELGQFDDTLVIYSSDHGDWVGEFGMVHKTAHFYDHHTRVPFILSWPNGLAGGRKVAGLAQAVDMFPTVCDLLGMKVRDDVQGKSLKPLLDGSAEKVHDYVFSEAGFAQTEQSASYGANYAFWYKGKMCRGERYKYTIFETGEEEFYDLEKDPWEMKNLINDASLAKQISEHRRQLALFMINSEQPMPEFPPA